ncbi:hypothetical protein OPKNFCMD_3658 [Methylobacterium crusticola]|uniref:Uncharacterized protein n=1 Tax=Methylobacterium crusticola TaxID=1697972 RepID=A0ABQ4R0F8_9HYPH|nr:hypothetical protein OPKNFCMD_3658 [Methylobacterium crusticola]
MADAVKAFRSPSTWPHWRESVPAAEPARSETSRAGLPPKAAEPPDRCLTAPELIRLARSARPR